MPWESAAINYDIEQRGDEKSERFVDQNLRVKSVHNKVNDLPFWTRILKVQRILLTKKRDEKPRVRACSPEKKKLKCCIFMTVAQANLYLEQLRLTLT